MKPNKLVRSVWVLAVALVMLQGDAFGRELRPGFQSRDATLFHGEGIVHRIDHGAQTALISGLEYRFSPTARVQLNGGFGTWSMLLPAMKVDFIYYEGGPTQRTIVELYQLPPGAAIEGH